MRGHKPCFPALARVDRPRPRSHSAIPRRPVSPAYAGSHRFAPVHTQTVAQRTNPKGFSRFLKLPKIFFRVLANHVHSTKLDETRLTLSLRATWPADFRCLLRVLEGFGSFRKVLEAFSSSTKFPTGWKRNRIAKHQPLSHLKA